MRQNRRRIRAILVGAVLLLAVSAASSFAGYQYRVFRGKNTEQPLARSSRLAKPPGRLQPSSITLIPPPVEQGNIPEQTLGDQAVSASGTGEETEDLAGQDNLETTDEKDVALETDQDDRYSDLASGFGSGRFGRLYLLSGRGLDDVLASEEIGSDARHITDDQRKQVAATMRAFRKKSRVASAKALSEGYALVEEYISRGDYEQLQDEDPQGLGPLPNNANADVSQYFWITNSRGTENRIITIRRSDFPYVWWPVEELEPEHKEALARIREILGR